MEAWRYNLHKSKAIRRFSVAEGVIYERKFTDANDTTHTYSGWLVTVKIGGDRFLDNVPYFGGTVHIGVEEEAPEDKYDSIYGLFVPPKIKSKVLVVWEQGRRFRPYVLQSYPFQWILDPNEHDGQSNKIISHFADAFLKADLEDELDDIILSNIKGNRINFRKNGDVIISTAIKDLVQSTPTNTVFKKTNIKIERSTGNISHIANAGNDDFETTITQNAEDGSIKVQRTGENSNDETFELGKEYANVKLTDNVKLAMISTPDLEKITAQTSSDYKIEIDQAAGKIKVNGGGATKDAARKFDEILADSNTTADDAQSIFTYLSVLKGAIAGWVPTPQDGGAGLKAALSGWLALELTKITGKINEGSGTCEIGD